MFKILMLVVAAYALYTFYKSRPAMKGSSLLTGVVVGIAILVFAPKIAKLIGLIIIVQVVSTYVDLFREGIASKEVAPSKTEEISIRTSLCNKIRRFLNTRTTVNN